MISSPLFIAFFLVLAVIFLGYYVITRNRSQASSEANRRVADILDLDELVEPDASVDSSGSPERTKRPRAINTLAERIADSEYAKQEDSRSFMSELDRRLILAGIRNSYSPEQAIAASLAIWSFGTLLPVLAALAFPINPFVVIMVAVFFLFYPFLKLRSLINNRQSQIDSEIPSFISNIAMALSANLTIDEAIIHAARTSSVDSDDSILPAEFAVAQLQYSVGGYNQETALRMIRDRCGTESVDNFVEALVQGILTGSDLARVLEDYVDQAQEMWNQSMREFKNKKDPAITIGVVITMFGGVIIYMTPLAMEVMRTMTQTTG